MRGIARKSAPINVIVHYPKTIEGQRELAERVGEVILDGSEDEQWQTETSKTNVYRFLVPIPNNKYKSGC